MRLIINGLDVSGKVSDLAKIIEIAGQEEEPKSVPKPPQITYADLDDSDDFVEMPVGSGITDAIQESIELRRKLEADPNYNPFPGVVSPIAEVPASDAVSLGNTNLAEKDTGVQK